MNKKPRHHKLSGCQKCGYTVKYVLFQNFSRAGKRSELLSTTLADGKSGSIGPRYKNFLDYYGLKKGENRLRNNGQKLKNLAPWQQRSVQHPEKEETIDFYVQNYKSKVKLCEPTIMKIAQTYEISVRYCDVNQENEIRTVIQTCVIMHQLRSEF